MSDEMKCPDCLTNNVNTWVYDPPGESGKKRVIDCNECHEMYEETLE